MLQRFFGLAGHYTCQARMVSLLRRQHHTSLRCCRSQGQKYRQRKCILQGRATLLQRCCLLDSSGQVQQCRALCTFLLCQTYQQRNLCRLHRYKLKCHTSLPSSTARRRSRRPRPCPTRTPARAAARRALQSKIAEKRLARQVTLTPSLCSTRENRPQLRARRKAHVRAGRRGVAQPLQSSVREAAPREALRCHTDSKECDMHGVCLEAL